MDQLSLFYIHPNPNGTAGGNILYSLPDLADRTVRVVLGIATMLYIVLDKDYSFNL